MNLSKGMKLLFTFISSFSLQVITIISGFIIPRLTLVYYGSDVYGLVSSIAQFIQVFTFLEMGVGAVVQSALYKPLFSKDNFLLSAVVKSATNFFQKLGMLLLVYILILSIFYPQLVNSKFDGIYTCILIIAMSTSLFSQYFLGMVDRLLLNADQKGYVSYVLQIITVILSTGISAVMMISGCSIQSVKIVVAIIYLFRPIVTRLYINKYYNIDRNVCHNEDVIKQKWNGVFLHISATVLESTDVIVLTMFSSLKDVSVYSVYRLVVYGIKYLFTSTTNGLQAYLGELFVKDQLENLEKKFKYIEWSMHNCVMIIFGVTGTLILPFIALYTSGIDDAQYLCVSFGMLMVAAHGLHCICHIYNTLVKACNFYRETQNCYLIAALINIIASVITVKMFGLVGVTIGTCIAVIYQMVWLIHYCNDHILKDDKFYILRLFAQDVFILIVGSIVCVNIDWNSSSYSLLVIKAFGTLLIWSLLCVASNMFFYKEETMMMVKKIILRRG